MIYWIRDIDSGRLGIAPRPRGGDWLEDEIRSLHQSGVDVVVSLLEREEVVELELKKEGVLCESNGMMYFSFPIADRNIPQSSRNTEKLVYELRELLMKGKRIVIHCRQGVGRSAMIAACLLARSGVRVEEAFAEIAKARGCTVPETQQQREWVARFEKRC